MATLSLLALAVGVAGCSDDDDGGDDPGLPASTSYAGFVASTTGATGPLNITFASPVNAPPMPSAGGTGPSFSSGAPTNATGTVSLGSAPVAIAGTIDDGTLHMEGSGWVLDGTLLNGVITGTFTGPGGISGSLSALSSTEGSPARIYCGLYDGIDYLSQETVSGTFSLAIAGSILLGSIVEEDSDGPQDFAGTANQGAGTISVDMSADGGRLVVEGSFDETGISGTYDTYLGNNHVQQGDFTGTIGCTPS